MKIIKEIKAKKDSIKTSVKKIDQQGKVADQSDFNQNKDEISLIFKS